MTTKRLLGIATLAAGIVSGSAAYADGDVYEIRPCTAEGVARDAYASMASPLTSGEDVYFMIRLKKRSVTSTAWYVDYNGLGSREIYESLYPMQIGVYVSGQLRYATLVGSAPNATNGNFTDLIFHYKTEVGDVAFPVVLAVNDGSGNPVPANTEDDDTLAYYLNPARYGVNNWIITNGDGDDCNFWLGGNALPYHGAPPDASRMSDYDLSQCGIYVQTIDFDDEWEISKSEPTALWRSVHAGSSFTVGATPRLEATAEATRAVTLHVWSDNEDAVRIKGGRQVELVIGAGSGLTKLTWVGDITIAGGETYKDFSIEGVTEGGTANLILSPWDNYRYPPGTGVDEYITVPVKCVEPLPASVVVAADRLTATADGDYMTAKARLSVYLTQPSDVPVTITVTPQFEDGHTGAWGSYVRFSTTQDSVQTLPSGDAAPSVTIPAHSTEKKAIYVYTLRGDVHTVGDGHQMQFVPSMSAAEEAASGIHDMSAAGMWISAAKPVITSPSSTSEYDVISGNELEIDVAVDDTFADKTDEATGYKVEIKTTATSNWEELTERFKASGEGGALVGLTSGKSPKIKYTAAGDQVSQIRVTAPISGKVSEVTSFTVHVAAKMTASITSNVDVAREGESATFTVGLSADNQGNTLYAFVLASDSDGNATASRFSASGRKFLVTSDMDATALARTRGIPIGDGKGGPGKEVSGSVKFLDGVSLAEGDGLTCFYFDVAICSTESYDANSVVYEAYGPMIEVLNLPPSVDRIEMNDEKPLSGGTTFRANPYVGSPVKFKAIVTDPGSYDLTDNFKTRWTVYGPAKIDPDTITGNPNLDANAKTITFPKAGDYEIYVEVQDKDMASTGAWIESNHYTVTVDLPHLIVTPSATEILENETYAFIRVDIGQPNSADPIVVKLTVTPAAVNPGRLVLDPEYKTAPVGYPAPGANEYYIVFRDEDPVNIAIVDLDGTAKSKFTVKAEVLNTTASIDPTRTWAQYYTDNSAKTDNARITVSNVDPVPGYNITTPNTNAWKVAGGPATSFPIRWQVRSDVDADFTETWQNGQGPGIKVSITGCENEQSFYVTEPGASGVFIPDFGNEQGEKTVTLVIEDKDNGSTEAYQYLYLVEASKFLMTTATGPSGGNTTSALSQKYAVRAGGLGGLGEGHIWVPSAKFSGARDFTLSWNCSKLQTIQVYAAGYKTTARTDNGSLDGATMYANDIPLNPNGNNSTAGNVALQSYYTYPDTERDSYLYTWLYHTVGDSGGMSSAILGSIAPEKAESRHAHGLVPLAGEANQDGAYADTYVEAIFSKEWRPLDNCGDINQDGIPDRALVEYGLGVYDVDAGTLSGNDLSTLVGYNEDGDSLPGGYEAGNALVPNVSGSWETSGGPFHAFFEIRGFGAGLNAGYPNPDGSDPAPDYTTFEQRAYLAWKGLATEDDLAGMSDDDVQTLFDANIADATADLKAATSSAGVNGWSPERPTDPTVEDTDEDELPDGYEFWFWYGARVGYSQRNAAGVLIWQGRLTGKRLNLADIEVFDTIPSDEIVGAFDPRVNGGEANALTGAAGSVRKRDFDNDGLTDYEEMLIGSSPVNCDTDGDGLSDGWEVMWNLSPLNGGGSDGAGGNPDGDFMAAANSLIWDDGIGAWTPGATIVEFDLDGLHYVYLTRVDADDPEDLGDEFEGCRIGTPSAQLTLDGCLRTLGGDRIPRSITASMTVSTEGVENLAVRQIIPGEGEGGIWLIHDQVRMYFGYDARTGWYMNEDGYVSDRWDPAINNVDARLGRFRDAGLAVNTRGYSNRAEYAFGKYRPRAVNGVLAWLRACCTNPSPNFEAATWGDSTTQYESAVHGADTDANGVPDGWEAYVGFDPINNPNNTDNNLQSDYDEDGLSLAAEYMSNDGAKAYADCEPVAANTTSENGWYNKFFPTDPHDADTDGDGVGDLTEGESWFATFYTGRTPWPNAYFTFIYGSPTDDDRQTCIRGGGLNPNCADTDFDGLPDEFERQGAGIEVQPSGEVAMPEYNSDDMYTLELRVADGFGTADFSAPDNYIMGGLDGTDGGDAVTLPTRDAATNTFRDRDFDHDGLENFQEYLVQTVRMWRYDDTETPLMGRSIIWSGDPATTRLSDPVDTGWWVPVDTMNGARYFTLVVNAPLFGYGDVWTPANTADNVLAAEVSAAGAYDFVSLGYFAPAKNDWDPVAMMEYPFMRKPVTLYGYDPIGNLDRRACGAYVTTDPRRWDSDDDGMDDYWEVFHGLNPLLGGSDVISDAYALNLVNLSSTYTPWAGMEGAFEMITDPGLDPFLAPWRMGLPDADPDGDGLRNIDESIMGNMTSPTTYHTDPSPLWMTDPSSPMSYVTQFYPFIQGPLDMISRDMQMLPWTWAYDAGIGTAEGADSDPQFRFSYERTEGYDTDGDWRGDNHELVKAVLDRSDPLDADDPARRSALYLPGAGACAYSYIEGNLPVVDAYDVFRQFTVEMWIKPEKKGAEQTIFERGFVYPPSNLQNDEPRWRANFRVALDEEGVVYGMFDNDNAVESGAGETFSCQTAKGRELPLNEWSHVALSFDGKALRLYIDGELRTTAPTGLIPANGIISVQQNPGDTNNYPSATYNTLAGANTIGARRAVTEFDWTGGFDQFTDFYKGYVSEVRLWDGARSSGEIKNAYKTRMTPKDIAGNRDDVFSSWFNEGTRNDNDGKPNLPAHLLAHWNFSQLPSAVEAADVAKTPSGFLAVLDNCRIGGKDGTTPAETVVGWWSAAATLHSTVYDDYHVVPWIQNTVSTLPLLDASLHDSMFWSEPYAGYMPAMMHGVESYLIPNGGNPYKGRVYRSETDLHALRLRKLAEYDADAGFRAQQYQFEMSRQFVGLDSLVPLGGAFAKRDVDYWDGQGAATVWSDTGSDADGDDLPDWWEEYARANYGAGDDLDPSTTVDYNGTAMTAGEAYVRDLAHGMLPSKTVDRAYLNREDKNFDGLPDWWGNMYGLSSRGDEDEDLDGLSNYTEYLLSEVFDLGRLFSPVDAFSVSDNDTDYFFKIGKLYAGEIFTDHDMMEDGWEAGRGVDYVSRYAWDAASDNDEDRWSAFAECRYNSFVSSILGENISHMLGDAEIKDFPVPTLALTLRYNQSQDLSGGGDSAQGGSQQGGQQGGEGDNEQENTLAPIIVKTYTPKASQELNVVPDATFKIRPGESVDRIFYIGAYGERIVRGTLTPGYLEPGSFYLEMAQVAQNNSYTWRFTAEDGTDRYLHGSYASYMYYYNMYGPERVELQSEEFNWQPFENNNIVTVSQDGDSPEGYIRLNGVRAGTINTQTGAFSLDMSALADMGIENPTNGTTYSLTEAVFRIGYKAKVPVLQSNRLRLYLGTANIGAVREGKNRVVAFYDLDDDGEYTPGEPLGFANDVDVSWFRGEAEMELTDTSPIITRAALRLGGSNGSSGGGSSGDGGDSETPEAELDLTQSDRSLLYGTENGDYRKLVVGKLSGGKYERFRVVRTLVKFADQPIDELGYGVDYLGVAGRTVVDKWLELDQRNFFFEGDVLENGALDLDWYDLESDVVRNPNLVQLGVDPVEVTYRIILGNGNDAVDGTNNLYSIATVRHFDPKSSRAKPEAFAPGSQAAAVYGARPTFKWTMNGNNSYTAFKVQIMTQSGSTVWDSGVMRAPATDLDGVYTYEPEVYAGDQLSVSQNYKWRVSMYNAKFKSTDLWSNEPEFRMNTLTNSYDYGSIKVAVRYFGPSEVLSSGNVYVEAYDTPDFSGAPVGRVILTDKASVSAVDAKHEANATLIGLPKGTYYVRAFVDNNFSGNDLANDRVRDAWESWGYVCPRQGESSYMFSPTAITIGEEARPTETFTCYIEDVDTNGNCLPDAWEMVKNNGKLDNGTENIDDTLASGVAINKGITDNLQALQGDGTSSSGLAAYSFAVVKNAGVAALMLAVDTPTSKTYTEAIEASAASNKVEAKNVRFTLVRAAEGALVVKADGAAEAVSGSGGSTGLRVYSLGDADGSTLTGQLMTSTDLVNWEKATKAPNGGKVNVTVEGGVFSTGEIDLGAYAGDEKRFFRIEMN